VSQTALSKTEATYTSATRLLPIGMMSMSEFLLPRIQAAKRRLVIERVGESLIRATCTYTTVADLSKLESQILDARKVRPCFELGSARLRPGVGLRSGRCGGIGFCGLPFGSVFETNSA